MANSQPIPVICECSSFTCVKTVSIPMEEYEKIMADGYFVIVEGCPNGPSESDVLVEKRERYSLYREQK